MSFSFFIPARLESSRLPQKMMINIYDRPLIVWTYERASKLLSYGPVTVLTDSETIFSEIKSRGGEAWMTLACSSGTDRIISVLPRIHSDWVINIQGDEPLFSIHSIEFLMNLCEQSSSDICSLAYFIDSKDAEKSSKVKVVLNSNQEAMYFSRSAIPFSDPALPCSYLCHMGIYAYRRSALEKIKTFSPPELCHFEKLEQLSFLYYGLSIRIGVVDQPSIGIDTEEDLNEFRKKVSS